MRLTMTLLALVMQVMAFTWFDVQEARVEVGALRREHFEHHRQRVNTEGERAAFILSMNSRALKNQWPNNENGC